jgi:hypothetical protein
MDQVVEYLPSKHEVLNTDLSKLPPPKKKKPKLSNSTILEELCE